MPFKQWLKIISKPESITLLVLINVLSFFYLDQVIADYFFQWDLGNKAQYLNWVTHIGLGLPYIFGFALMALFFRYGYIHACFEARCWFLWLSVTLTGIICVIIKVLIGRARPILWFNYHDYGFYGLKTNALFWSCPSGHTTTIMTVAFSLSIIVPAYRYWWLVMGMLLSFTRVLLTYHYLSDVLIAATIAAFEMGGLVWFIERQGWFIAANRFKNQKKIS